MAAFFAIADVCGRLGIPKTYSAILTSRWLPGDERNPVTDESMLVRASLLERSLNTCRKARKKRKIVHQFMRMELTAKKRRHEWLVWPAADSEIAKERLSRSALARRYRSKGRFRGVRGHGP